MNFNIYNIFILAGVIQGFIFTIVFLINKKYRAKSTLFLIGLIFTYSLSNLMFISPDIGIISLYDMYRLYFIPLGPLIPVLIYFYVVLFLNPHKKIKLIEKLLFVPFIIDFLLVLYCRLAILLGYENESLIKFLSYVVNIQELFSILYSIIIMLIVTRKIFLYETNKASNNSKIIRINVSWLKYIIIIIFIFTLVWGYLVIDTFFGSDDGDYPSFYPLWLAMAVLIYLFGHIGVYKYGIISERKKIRKYLEANYQFKSIETNFKPSESNSFNQYIEKLKDLFNNEKIYLDSNLNLERISQYLQLSPTYLSKIIHTELQTSLPEFINQYRVEEAKRNLINSEFSKYTILSIGLEAGFNSKSSFYNTFKKHTGKTPVEYRNQHLQ